MQTPAPPHARVAARVPAVEAVLIVEVYRPPPSLLRVRRPLQYLLGPVHAQVVVLFPRDDELALRRVPQRVVRRAPLELLQGVHEQPGVRRVIRQGPPRPIGHTLVSVVVWIVQTVVDGQLSSHDQFVEEDVHRPSQLGSGRRHLPCSVRHVHDADLTVVYVRREVRLQAQGRIVAGPGVVTQLRRQEVIELAKSLALPADVVPVRGLDAPVHTRAEDSGVERVEARVDGVPQGHAREPRHPDVALAAEKQSLRRRPGQHPAPK